MSSLICDLLGGKYKEEPTSLWIDNGKPDNPELHPSYNRHFSLPELAAEKICKISETSDQFAREIEYFRCGMRLANQGYYFIPRTIFRSLTTNSSHPSIQRLGRLVANLMLEAVPSCSDINPFNLDGDFNHLVRGRDMFLSPIP